MTIRELIERLRRDTNARIAAYNELGVSLDKVREAETPDAVREAELITQRSAAAAEIQQLGERIKQLEAEAETDAAVARLQSASTQVDNRAAGAAASGVQYGAETNPVYRKDNVENSFFRDLFHSRHMGDEKARQRLIASQETRAVNSTAGTGGEFAPPLWLISDFVELARAGRITADRMVKETLPSGVSSVNLPKITAGNTVGVTQTQNTAITEGSVTTTSVSSGITEITGKQTIAIALLRQSGTPLDRIIVSDLAAAYANALNTQVISGSAANGQLRGLITAGTTVTYTTTQPAVVSATAANSFYMKVLGAQAALAGSRYLPADVIVMHPRRWSWILSALDGNSRPLVVPNGAGMNQAAVTGANVAQGFAGDLLGLPVYVDPTIPTNRGASTNQDVVFVMRAADLWLYESEVETASFDATLADQNSILYRVLGFSAFIPNRFTGSIQVIDGTGLVAPTF